MALLVLSLTLMILGALAAVALAPNSFFKVPRGGLATAARSDLSRKPLPEVIDDESAYLEQVQLYIKVQLVEVRIPELRTALKLITQADVERAGMDYEICAKIAELGEKLTAISTEDQFREAIEKLTESIREFVAKAFKTAEEASGVAATAVVAGTLAPLLGPLLAVAVAGASIAAAARHARDTAALRRGMKVISDLIKSEWQAQFEVA